MILKLIRPTTNDSTISKKSLLNALDKIQEQLNTIKKNLAENIEEPEDVRELEEGIFSKAPKSNSLSKFQYTDNKIGRLVKYLNEGETSITIPEGTAVIGAGVFAGNQDVEKVSIPKSVRVIEDDAFNGCTNLSQVIFADGCKCTNIGNQAFAGCSNLFSIRALPDTIKNFGDRAFRGCTQLYFSSDRLPSALTYLGGQVFAGCKSIEKLICGSNIDYIGDSPFYGCSALTLLDIPSNPKDIAGNNVFRGCSKDLEVYGVRGSVLDQLAEEANLRFHGKYNGKDKK